MTADTMELLRAAKAGDEAACEQVIRENSRLIWSIVRRFLGRGTDADALYQLGCMGLLKAIRGFDESFGNQFSTYAVPKIAGEIRRFLRDDGTVKVSRSLKEASMKIRTVRERLLQSLGREPALSELSEATGLTAEEIAQAEYATGTADSLNRKTGEDEQTLEDVLGDTGIEEHILDRVSLTDAMEKLPERERMVLYLRFYKGLTQDKSAKILEISQVQVSRLERGALKKLRDII